MFNFSQINNVIPQWIVEPSNSNITITTRIRMARNIKGFPYLYKISEKQTNELMEKINHAIKSISPSLNTLIFIKLSNQSQKFKQFLKERFLITDYLLKGENKEIVIDKNENINLMINEEDHLRIQVIYPGKAFTKALETIKMIEKKLEKFIEFDFNEEFGFLTSCPTNVGTGLRVSTMLHLPGLTLNNKIKEIIEHLNEAGFTVRGFSGEGSKYLGDLYQISNQTSLGLSENDILSRVENLTSEIEKREIEERKNLLKNNIITNSIIKSYLMIKNSNSLTFSDSMNHISLIKLGIDLNLIKIIHIHNINKLLIMIQPMHIAFLNKETVKTMDIIMENKLRSKMIKDFFEKEEICLKNFPQELNRV